MTGPGRSSGITGDIRHAALSDPFDANVYVPRRQVVRSNTWLLLKTDRPAAAVLAELQERTKSIDANVALTDTATMEARLAKSAAPERFRAIVTGTLAGLTLLLAIVGLHGVVSYAVTQRTREIRRPASRLVNARPMCCVSSCSRRSGASRRARCPGSSAAVYAGRWLSSVVMVNADQTGVLSAVVAIFVAAALAAAAGPAWRASRRGSYRRVANLLRSCLINLTLTPRCERAVRASTRRNGSAPSIAARESA